MKKYLRINDKDNVIVALEDLSFGDNLNNLVIKEDIKRGHKVALFDIKKGELIIKYGMPIGRAKEDILKGYHVHTSNTQTNLDEERTFSYTPNIVKVEENNDEVVNCYLREDGSVGIRNQLYVIPSVGCINKEALKLVEEFKKTHHLSANYDGIMVLTHPYGCSQLSTDFVNTKKAIINLALNPNAGGVLIFGLGCENNQVSKIKEVLDTYPNKRIEYLVAQEVEDSLKEGLKKLEILYDKLVTFKRTKVSLSKIRVGLKCGGSDGMSGITANPLIGKYSDYLVSHNATSVLTEIPEMFGAEQIMLNRAINKDVYDKLLNVINDFKDYYKRNNQPIYENPSPGNKEGGITTLEDKSLGCIEKSGKTPVMDILQYNERIKINGLNILSAPGNDMVASTALGLSGCQLILFSTGRGTPFSSFIPTVKISSNTDLFLKKHDWIDFDSGLINQENSKEVLDSFIKYIKKVINGEYTKGEINDYYDIAIFKNGVTL